jgi:hypothetical protein
LGIEKQRRVEQGLGDGIGLARERQHRTRAEAVVCTYILGAEVGLGVLGRKSSKKLVRSLGPTPPAHRQNGRRKMAMGREPDGASSRRKSTTRMRISPRSNVFSVVVTAVSI